MSKKELQLFGTQIIILIGCLVVFYFINLFGLILVWIGSSLNIIVATREAHHA